MPAGTLKPEDVHLPGVYVHRLVQGGPYEKRIEKLRFAEDSAGASAAAGPDAAMRERIVRRAAREFENGMYVNLGIGMPTLASNYVPPGVTIELQSENGLLGMGPYPARGAADADAVQETKLKAVRTKTRVFRVGGCVSCASSMFWCRPRPT